jgi:MFS family permease
VILLALHAGHAADRFDRRRVVFVAQGTLALCSFGLALLSLTQGALILVYACLLGIGVARAFNNPASAALLPQTVPQAAFTNAATWSSSSWQLAAVLGPALGGILIALRQSAVPIYLLNTFGCLTFVVLVRLIQGKQTARTKEPATFKTLAAGAGFILRSKVILATITLDLFAVLLGGAVALMPVFAKDILRWPGLGWMRAAPSIGALLMAVIIAHRPPFRRADIPCSGPWPVLGSPQSFRSTTFCQADRPLGALDQISVVVRSTLLLTRAPDEVRVVYAVNSVFVGASNELGAFGPGLQRRCLADLRRGERRIGTILVVLTVMNLAGGAPAWAAGRALTNASVTSDPAQNPEDTGGARARAQPGQSGTSAKRRTGTLRLAPSPA